MLTEKQKKELEKREVDFCENGEWEDFGFDLAGQWKMIFETIQKYCSEHSSDSWRNGYLCGYKDCLKQLKHLENACAELAENGKRTDVDLMNGGKVIMFCMEMFGYEIDTKTGKYERR